MAQEARVRAAEGLWGSRPCISQALIVKVFFLPVSPVDPESPSSLAVPK